MFNSNVFKLLSILLLMCPVLSSAMEPIIEMLRNVNDDYRQTQQTLQHQIEQAQEEMQRLQVALQSAQKEVNVLENSLELAITEDEEAYELLQGKLKVKQQECQDLENDISAIINDYDINMQAKKQAELHVAQLERQNELDKIGFAIIMKNVGEQIDKFNRSISRNVNTNQVHLEPVEEEVLAVDYSSEEPSFDDGSDIESDYQKTLSQAIKLSLTTDNNINALLFSGSSIINNPIRLAPVYVDARLVIIPKAKIAKFSFNTTKSYPIIYSCDALITFDAIPSKTLVDNFMDFLKKHLPKSTAYRKERCLIYSQISEDDASISISTEFNIAREFLQCLIDYANESFHALNQNNDTNSIEKLNIAKQNDAQVAIPRNNTKFITTPKAKIDKFHFEAKQPSRHPSSIKRITYFCKGSMTFDQVPSKLFMDSFMEFLKKYFPKPMTNYNERFTMDSQIDRNIASISISGQVNITQEFLQCLIGYANEHFAHYQNNIVQPLANPIDISKKPKAFGGLMGQRAMIRFDQPVTDAFVNQFYIHLKQLSDRVFEAPKRCLAPNLKEAFHMTVDHKFTTLEFQNLLDQVNNLI